jgi:riboflavin kinase
MMEITGTVTTGLGKAAYFLGQDFYKNQFMEKCEFTPFPGTLNIIVDEGKLEDIQLMKNSCNNVIQPDEGFGAVKYIKAYLNEDIAGAIVFPAKTTHEEHYLEFIAKDKLRDKYGFEDGDEVKLTIDL